MYQTPDMITPDREKWIKIFDSGSNIPSIHHYKSKLHAFEHKHQVKNLDCQLAICLLRVRLRMSIFDRGSLPTLPPHDLQWTTWRFRKTSWFWGLHIDWVFPILNGGIAIWNILYFLMLKVACSTEGAWRSNRNIFDFEAVWPDLDKADGGKIGRPCFDAALIFKILVI